MKRDKHYRIESQKGIPVAWYKTESEAKAVRNNRWPGYVVVKQTRPTL